MLLSIASIFVLSNCTNKRNNEYPIYLVFQDSIDSLAADPKAHEVSQDGMDSILESSMEAWIKQTDFAMSMYRLLMEENYDGAQDSLENYLLQQITVGEESKKTLESTNGFSESLVEKAKTKTDKQVYMIKGCLDFLE